MIDASSCIQSQFYQEIGTQGKFLVLLPQPPNMNYLHSPVAASKNQLVKLYVQCPRSVGRVQWSCDESICGAPLHVSLKSLRVLQTFTNKRIQSNPVLSNTLHRELYNSAKHICSINHF